MKAHSPRRKRQPDRVKETMAAEYDFSKSVRGATTKRHAAGSNIVVLDPDVAAVFPDAAAVNEALRLLTRLAEATSSRRPHRGRPRAKKR